MDNPLKQRLIGALVLIALLSLVLPLFFNEPPQNKIETLQPIPSVPDFQPIVVREPELVGNIPADVSLEEMYQMPTGITGEIDRQGDSEPVLDTTSEGTADALKEPVSLEKALAAPVKEVRKKAFAVEEKPVLAENGIPVSWVVQVISYSEKAMADKLEKQLQVQGYPAFTRTATIKGNTLTRVFVGPKLQKGKAERIKEIIDKQYKVKSLVLEFKPI